MAGLFRDQLPHKLPAREDKNPVGDSLQFDEVGRKQQHRCALRGEFVDDPVDFCFRANIDTHGGFVEQVQVRARAQPFRQDDLLLITARELTQGGVASVSGAQRAVSMHDMHARKVNENIRYFSDGTT